MGIGSLSAAGCVTRWPIVHTVDVVGSWVFLVGQHKTTFLALLWPHLFTRKAVIMVYSLLNLAEQATM